MAVPSLPAHGSPDWFAWAQGLHDEVATGRLSDAELGAAFGSMRVGHRHVPLGDSITIAGDDYANGQMIASDSYAAWIALLSGGRISFVRNAGQGGDKTADMLARFDTDVTPYAPTMVSVMGGTNDFTFAVSLATFQANIKALVAKIRGIGAFPVLFTTPPVNGLPAPDKNKIVQSNAWLARYAAANNIPLIDAYRTWLDPATSGNWQAALTGDGGVHPNAAGQYALAQAAAAVLNPLLPPVPPLLSPFAADTLNLVGSAGFFTADANADGISDNWSVNWTPAAGTFTPSRVTDAQVPGTMQRLALSGAGDKYQMRRTVTTGFSAGDVLRLSGVVTTAATAGMVGFGLSAVCAGAGKTFSREYRAATVTRAVPVLDFTAPAGTTSIDVQIKAQNVGTTTGNADYGQVTLYNLTTGGLLNL